MKLIVQESRLHFRTLNQQLPPDKLGIFSSNFNSLPGVTKYVAGTKFPFYADSTHLQAVKIMGNFLEKIQVHR